MPPSKIKPSIRRHRIRNVKLVLLNSVLLVISIFIMHETLPPNKVQGYTVDRMDTSFLKNHPQDAMSPAYAKWEFEDYWLLKYAHSKVLGVTLIGAPFQHWKVHKID